MGATFASATAVAYVQMIQVVLAAAVREVAGASHGDTVQDGYYELGNGLFSLN